MGRSSFSRCSSSGSRSSASGPTRRTRTGRLRQARIAPRISGSGALSEPTASRTMSVSIGAQTNTTNQLLGCFLDVQHGAALVGPALGAGAMRQLLLVTVGALGDADGGQEVVRAAVGSSARRMAPFRIRHDKIPFVFPPAGLTAPGQPYGKVGTPSISWGLHLGLNPVAESGPR